MTYMMNIYRQAVLFSEKRTLSSLLDENKEIFGCLAQRNYFELMDFQTLNDTALRTKVYNEKNNYDYLDKDSGYRDSLLDSEDVCTVLNKGKLPTAACQTKQQSSCKQFPEKRKFREEETSQMSKSSVELEKKMFVESSFSKPQSSSQLRLNYNKAKASVNDVQVILAKVMKILLKEPLSSELSSYLMSIFCQTEDSLSNMIYEMLRKSPLEPVARDNGMHLLQQVQPNHCEEIINETIQDLTNLSELAYDYTYDGLKLLDETMLLLLSLKNLLLMFFVISSKFNNELFHGNSKYIKYKKSCNIFLWRSCQRKKVEEWKRRLEKLTMLKCPQVLFMMGKCVELLCEFT